MPPHQSGELLHYKRYRIEKVLGIGGQGVVYQAQHLTLGMPVAIKMLFDRSQQTREHILWQARLLVTLSHPVLPKVMDFFERDQRAYVVMEYVEGEDLEEGFQKKGAPPMAHVLSWADALLDALDYLHRQEPPIIHRDIKPGNLKVTPNGRLYLVDFGLAKEGGLSHVTHQTAKGFSEGFAPPEQYGSARTDARSDLYALGATLYFLLSGTIPAAANLRASGQVVAPLHHLNADVFPEFSAWIERAMRLNRDGRWKSAAEMRQKMPEPSSWQMDTISLSTSPDVEGWRVTVPMVPPGFERSHPVTQTAGAVQPVTQAGGSAYTVTPPRSGSFSPPQKAKSQPKTRHSAPLLIALILSLMLILGVMGWFVFSGERPAELPSGSQTATIGAGSENSNDNNNEAAMNEGEDLTPQVTYTPATPFTTPTSAILTPTPRVVFELPTTPTSLAVVPPAGYGQLPVVIRPNQITVNSEQVMFEWEFPGETLLGNDQFAIYVRRDGDSDAQLVGRTTNTQLEGDMLMMEGETIEMGWSWYVEVVDEAGEGIQGVCSEEGQFLIVMPEDG